MDAEFHLQPGDELFLFDRQAEVSLIDTPDGVILSIDGPDGEWSATIHGPSGDDPWDNWLFWG